MTDKSTANHAGRSDSYCVENLHLKNGEYDSGFESNEYGSSLTNADSVCETEHKTVGPEGDKLIFREQVSDLFIPPHFSKVIPVIAQFTEAGYVCFLNPESLEVEPVTGSMLDDPEAFYASHGKSEGQEAFQHLLWDDYLMFEPVAEKDLQRLVKEFMKYLTGLPVFDKMIRLMKKGKAYAKLDAVLIKSSHSDLWARYKEHFFELIITKKLAQLLSENNEEYDRGSKGF